ncbi:D-alanyl-D-alanine carboxypeptidase family protein [Cellulomonas sp. Sa3CUA2]|uniref:D-alanyl-D-alanine carboxypeptidase family protein n=1 Tax=Cellulomonas avistercoris TaxID=2762242 RepID=A0ABR8QAA4_9CELL|nr:M15 family metallopeptidase [Cellulomonas avistercoris]MBD7917366.1 D-alanyl-D-alanine carboxypeptidase family protein [Cellulomonas avistercoris]
MPTRIAQAGVALGLVLSMGAVVVTAEAEEPSTASVAGEPTLALAPDAGTASPQLRAQAVDAAIAAVDQVGRVRADAAQVAVPEDVLAELDAATAELQEAIADVDAQPVVRRDRSASRSAERGEADATPATTPDAATMGPTAEPTTDAAPATDDAAPADDAAEPATPAETDALVDTTLPDTTDPLTAPLREALDRVRQAAQVVLSTTEQKRAEAEAAQLAAQVAEQQAAEQAERAAAEQAAQRAAWKASLGGYANGKVPASALCSPSFAPSAQLRCDAAEALEGLNAAYAARFGTPLTISDSYRSYAGQVACRAAKGRMCAAPGTSNHGMGVAVDLGGGVQTFGTAQHQWMRDNAPSFQWILPEWARAGGSKPEAWHWEYVG